MKINAGILLNILRVLTWAGFIGLCIKVCSLMISFGISIYLNPVASSNLYMGLDLSNLKNYDSTAYIMVVFCIIGIISLQTGMFWVLLIIFKHINLMSPFHERIRQLILSLSILSCMIGILSKITFGYTSRLMGQGMRFPNLFEHIGLGDAFIFFAGILFFISVLYQKGIELQNENDLTI